MHQPKSCGFRQKSEVPDVGIILFQVKVKIMRYDEEKMAKFSKKRFNQILESSILLFQFTVGDVELDWRQPYKSWPTFSRSTWKKSSEH